MRLEDEIVGRLHNAGFEVYLVGGAVRDMLLDIPPHDFDYATNARPTDILKIFSDKKLGVVGKRFKLVMVEHVQVATYRKDVQDKLYDPKHCKPVYADSIEEDLARRDLTINAMAINPITDEFLDPFGGEKDLYNNVLRLVGDPRRRLAEDPNRVIRACRFLAKIEGVFDYDTLGALTECAEYIKHYVDPERTHEEIIKAMDCNTPSIFFSALEYIDALKYLFPEMSTCFKHTGGTHHKETIGEHLMLCGDNISKKFPLLRLAGYLHDIGKPFVYTKEGGAEFPSHEMVGADITRKRLKNLRFSNQEVSKITNLIEAHMRVCLGLTPKGTRRLRKYLSDNNIDPRDFVRLKMADRLANVNRGRNNIKPVKGFITQTGIRGKEEKLPLNVNDLAMSGGALIKYFNLTPGPIVGKLQKHLLNTVLDKGEEFNTKESLIVEARSFLNK